MSEPSIFTRIVNGEIPCHKVYEDDHTLAFLDIHPNTEGHTLVIPKKQVEFLWDLDAEDYQRLMESVQKIGQHLREVLDVPYVGIKVMGTDVPHTHVHLVPFTAPEEFKASGNLNSEPDHTALAALAARLAF